MVAIKRPKHADFGEAVLFIGGVGQKAYFFVIDLPHSDRCFARAYTNLHGSELLSPLAASDGHDVPGLPAQPAPGITAMIDDGVAGFKDAVGGPIIPQGLPDVFDWTEFQAFGWQRDIADIPGSHKRGGHMPPGLIREQDGMGARFHGSGDFGKMWVHRAGIAERQDKPCTLARCRIDRSKDADR